MDLLHDVIDEQIFLELFLKDQDLVLSLNAVVTVQPPHLKILRQDARVQIHHHCVILRQSLDLSLESSKVFFHLKHLKISLVRFIFFFLLFYEIKQSNSRILFFIDTANYLTMVDVLILRNLRKSSRNFLIFLSNLTTLDSIVVYHEIPRQQQHLLLTEEPHAEQIRLRNSIPLHELELLEVHIEKH